MRTFRVLIYLMGLVGLMALAPVYQAQAEHGLQVNGAWARPSIDGSDMSAAYFRASSTFSAITSCSVRQPSHAIWSAIAGLSCKMPLIALSTSIQTPLLFFHRTACWADYRKVSKFISCYLKYNKKYVNVKVLYLFNFNLDFVSILSITCRGNIMYNIKSQSIVVTFLLTLLLTACGPQSTPATPTPEPLNVAVQLSWFHQAQFSGFYSAVDQNYYTEEGLNVSILSGGISEAGYISPIQQVLEGKAQFGLANTNEIMKSQAAGNKVVAIASTLQRSPRGFMSLAGKNIMTPSDFIGKRIAYRPDDDSIYLALLNAVGISRNDLIEITDSSKFTLDALINDEIDVIPMFLDNELVTMEERGFEVNVILVFDYGIETYENLIFTTQDLIDQNPDLVLKFLRATLKGYDYVVASPDIAAALALQYDSNLVLETQQKSTLRLIPLFKPGSNSVGIMTADVWQRSYDTLITQGILTAPLDVTKQYNLSFLNQIYGSNN